MRSLVLVGAVALLGLLAGEARAGDDDELDALAWRADDIVVLDGAPIGFVQRSFRGAVPLRTRIGVPSRLPHDALQVLAFVEARPGTRTWKLVADPRSIAFVTTTSVRQFPRGTWLELGTPEQVFARVAEVAGLRGRFDHAVEDVPDVEERTRILAGIARADVAPASEAAIDRLGACDRAGLRQLAKLLAEDDRVRSHPLAIRALARTRVPEAEERVRFLLAMELSFWHARGCPEDLWDRPDLGAHLLRLEALLDAVGSERFVSCRELLHEFVRVWHDRPPLQWKLAVVERLVERALDRLRD